MSREDFAKRYVVSENPALKISGSMIKAASRESTPTRRRKKKSWRSDWRATLLDRLVNLTGHFLSYLMGACLES